MGLQGFSITSIRNTFKPKYLQIYSQRIVTMTTFIPSLTLPAALFANPAASILFPIALGTAVGFSVRPKETQKTYMALKQPPYRPPPCFRSSMDRPLRPNGLLRLPRLHHRHAPHVLHGLPPPHQARCHPLHHPTGPQSRLDAPLLCRQAPRRSSRRHRRSHRHSRLPDICMGTG